LNSLDTFLIYENKYKAINSILNNSYYHNKLLPYFSEFPSVAVVSVTLVVLVGD
jgi:hypothetical protein